MMEMNSTCARMPSSSWTFWRNTVKATKGAILFTNRIKSLCSRENYVGTFQTVPFHGKTLPLLEQYFAMERHISLHRDTLYSITTRKKKVTEEFRKHPSPFTFCPEMPINTGGSEGEGWTWPFTHPSPPFTAIDFQATQKRFALRHFWNWKKT